jgi:hypothetical protein
MKSIAKILSLTAALFIATVAPAQQSKEILKDFLDSNVSIVVPVATNRVTTISFPSAITAIDGAGVTVDGKTPGLFQLAHTKGTAFLSVRALFPKASANLNIRWNDQTYVFELTESDQPVLSLNLDAPPTPEEEGVGQRCNPGRGQFAKARHDSNHDAGANPVGGPGAISNRVAADQNQPPGNADPAGVGERHETAARRARIRARPTAATINFFDQ